MDKVIDWVKVNEARAALAKLAKDNPHRMATQGGERWADNLDLLDELTSDSIKPVKHQVDKQ